MDYVLTDQEKAQIFRNMVRHQDFHVELENDIQKRKNGLFTCVIKVFRNDVIAYSVVEYGNSENSDYSFVSVIVEKLTTSFNP